MNPFNRPVRWVMCCLLTSLGLSTQSAQAAHTCDVERVNESAWVQQVTQIDKNLPLGTVIFQRLVKTKVTFKKTTTTEENVKITGHWIDINHLLPAPLLAIPISGTASGGGQLNGFGLRHTTATGTIFAKEKQEIFDSSFLNKEWIIHVYFFQHIVNTDNSALQGGTLNSTSSPSIFVLSDPTGQDCNGAWAYYDLKVTIPALTNSTCTLDTKLKDIAWPALSTREMALNAISNKRSMDIILSKCGKGVKPYMHFASYRDLARGQLNNPVASKKNNTIINGLSIRAKNASNGADIRFGDPNATTGDLANRFNIGTAANENATLTQTIDFYLERTTDKLVEGEWVSNMSYIISYP